MLSEDQLIRFDVKVLLLLLCTIISFSILVAFKVHYASVGMWNYNVPDIRGGEVGNIFGVPRGIRQDEWGVFTPWLLSQAAHDFPLENENLGAGKAPLVTNVPVRHITSVLRPQYWAFFLLDVERGFSFYWNFKVFGLLLNSFLLLMLLTGNHFWLSVLGALWLFFSGFVQWWFSAWTPEMIAAFCAMCIATIYILFSQKRWAIVLNSVIMIICSVYFALLLYPPFQIPLAYLFIAIIAGFALERRHFDLLKAYMAIRVICLAIIVCTVLGSLLLYYVDARDTIELITKTEYPGNRISAGGEIGIARFFSEFYGFAFGITEFPPKWGNISETSNFILLFPVVLLVFLWKAIAEKTINYLQLFLLAYLVFFALWILVGLPKTVARFLLLDRVPSIRAFIGTGVASIILAVHYLSFKGVTVAKVASPTQESKRKRRGDSRRPSTMRGLLSRLDVRADQALLLSLLVVAPLLIGHSRLLNAETGGYFKTGQIVTAVCLFTFISYLLLRKEIVLPILIVVLMALARNFNVNPIAYGLDPLLDRDLVRTVRPIVKEEPKAQWVVFGNALFAQLLMTSGANVLNGVKIPPNLNPLHRMDPDMKHERVYNRTGYVEIHPAPDQIEPGFQLFQNDSYLITLDPCSSVLADLGVKYFAFTVLPSEADVRCLTPLRFDAVDNVFLYRRRTADEQPAPSVLTLPRLESNTSSLITGIQMSKEGAYIVVDGWAIDSVGGTLAGGVYIEISGQLYQTTYGYERDDMPQQLANPAFRNCGFKALAPVVRLGRGNHIFGLRVLNNKQTGYFAPPERWSLELR